MDINIMEKKEVKQQHQSESITFRLDSTILNKLHREAEQKDISVNTLVSHIIRGHIDWPLDVIETWIKISGYPYRHEVNYTRHSYVIQHDMGKNWSLYLAELFRYLFEEFGLKRVEFDLTHNSLDFIVDTERR